MGKKAELQAFFFALLATFVVGDFSRTYTPAAHQGVFPVTEKQFPRQNIVDCNLLHAHIIYIFEKIQT